MQYNTIEQNGQKKQCRMKLNKTKKNLSLRYRQSKIEWNRM